MAEIKTDLKGLNEKQRKAVVSECRRLLVLAGAGSGKTKTLLQKLIYLIEQKGVNPSNILVITFTKNAANEMLDRLIMSADNTGEYAAILADKNRTAREKEKERYLFTMKYKWINNLTLKTFHSLCYGIIRDFGVNEFDNKFKVISKKQIKEGELGKYAVNETASEIIHKILVEKCASHKYLIDLKRYILNYIVNKIHLEKGEHAPLHQDKRYYTSLNGTKVRSKSEQYIADWLWRHNIRFEYEPDVNFGDFDFHPDFFIPAADLYLEHVSDKSYPIKGKERQFKRANKLLVKTFEHETKDTANFNSVLDRIVKNRLPANYNCSLSLTFEEAFKYHHKEVGDFVKQGSTGN